MKPTKLLSPENAVEQLLVKYGAHFVRSDLAPPAHRIKIDGSSVRATLTSGAVIAGSLTCWRTFAGHFWGATLRQRTFGEAAWIPVLFDRGHNGSSAWDPACELQRDLRVVMASMAQHLWNCHLEDEACIIAREIGIYGPTPQDDVWAALPLALVEASERGSLASQAIDKLFEKGSQPASSMMKAVVQFSVHASAYERAAVSQEFIDTVLGAIPGNRLSIHALFAEHILPLVQDPDPWVRERALAACERWVGDLMTEKAYAEALPLLDALADASVALDATLPQRFEARLGLGDEEGAAVDWARFDRLSTHMFGPQPVSTCMFWKGDAEDIRIAATLRAAETFLAWSLGRDPCRNRKITKAWRAALKDPVDLRLRARHLAEAAVAAWQGPVEEILSSNTRDAATTEHGFYYQAFSVLAAIDEADGRLEQALASYKKARDMIRAGGLSWQRDFFSGEIQRIGNAIHPGNASETSDIAIPSAFDPEWLIAPSTDPDAARRALDIWCAMPWPRLPLDAGAARRTPFARLLLKDLSLTDLPNTIDFHERSARVTAVVERFSELMDTSPQNAREFERWYMYGTMVGIAFGQADAVLPWFQRLESVPGNDEAAFLSTLPDTAFSKVSEVLTKLGAWYDPHHAFVTRLLNSGASVEITCAALRAFTPAFGADWYQFSGQAIPTSKIEPSLRPFEALNGDDLLLVIRDFLIQLREIPMHRVGVYSGETRIIPIEAMWPFAYAWHPEMDAFVASYVKGDFDLKSQSRSAKKKRIEFAHWLAGRMKAPKVESVAQAIQKRMRP